MRRIRLGCSVLVSLLVVIAVVLGSQITLAQDGGSEDQCANVTAQAMSQAASACAGLADLN